jgi:hypothetical protein
VYPDDDTTDVSDVFLNGDDDVAVAELKGKFKEWLSDMGNRSVAVMVPTLKNGTTKIIQNDPSNESFGEIYTVALVDSAYKNNEHSRIARFAAGAAALKEETKKKTAGGKSKRALEKKKEEERLAAEKIQKEIDDFISSLGSDGYLIVEGKTYDITPLPPNDTKIVVTFAQQRVMKSLEGGEEKERELYENLDSDRPSPVQYVQAPLWLRRFCPGNMAGVFFHDEVTLVMRQDSVIRPVLDLIEDDDMFMKICGIYEKSRLADLGRPAELHQVALDIIGVQEYFLADVLGTIWRETVPDEIKGMMVPLYDEFVKGYCLSRAMNEVEDALSNTEVFAKCIQKVHTCMRARLHTYTLYTSFHLSIFLISIFLYLSISNPFHLSSLFLLLGNDRFMFHDVLSQNERRSQVQIRHERDSHQSGGLTLSLTLTLT